GIQAAIHASRRKTKVLMLGRIEKSALYPAHVENYACIDGITDGKTLLEAGMAQLKRFGTEVAAEDILKIEQKEGGLLSLALESGRTVTSRSLILAMGVSKNKLGVPGEKEFAGRGVSYCVDCDANFYRGATVMVVGNYSAAIDGALTLLNYAERVYLVAEELNGSEALLERLEASKVEVLSGKQVEEIKGDSSGVKEILLKDSDPVKVDGIFIEIGSKGALELASQIGVQMDLEYFKYIDVNRKQETNIAGIYAAGDITGPPFQMAVAVGEGCVAGIEAAMFTRKKKD
ncbi:MAG: NAD(P)/FAD-dependent oxidoreductase, partial [Candidatus Electrothrix sp. AR3]|nr:NAD(P)/FAD-dependent oxidoreductase [Candidatus Electrothrix sp. AR3]